MKRLLNILVVLALIGYLAFKVCVWWLADQRIAEARDAVEDIGVIDRGEIRSGVEGSLTFVNGSYEDFRLSQPFEFGRLMFDAGSPVALVTALLDHSSLPSQWSVQGQGLAMVFDDELFRNWVTASEEADPSLFAPVCGPDHRQQLGSGDLLRLGVSGLFGEILVQQTRSSLYAEATTVETGSVEVRWPGARLNLMDPMAVFASTDQPMEVSLRDGGLMRGISAYCAREADLDTTGWTRLVMEAFRTALAARGYQPSDQLVALYRQWLTEGGELTLNLNPSRPLWGIPVRETGEETVALPFVAYNGAQVPDVFLTPVQPERDPVPVEAMEPVAPASVDDASGWQSIDKETAASQLGQRVRVSLENGNVVEGRLDAVDEKRLEVARPVDGGEVAYPMAIRLITMFEVWRRSSAL